MRNYLIGLSIAIVIYVPVVSWMIIRDIIVPPDVIDTMILFILASATIFYAIRTSDIAKATREQAEEMKEQRLSEARPYILLRLKGEFVDWPPPNEFGVTIRNEGKGPAINLEASLWHPKTVHPCDTKGYLAPGEEWHGDINTSDVGIPYAGEKEVRPWLPQLKKVIKQGDTGAVVVLYRDIHKRKWLSYLCLELHGDVPVVMDGEQNILERKEND